MLSRGELLRGEDALQIGLADAVAPDDLAPDDPASDDLGGNGLDSAVSAFLRPMLAQAPHVMRAFKALNLAQRRGASRQELLDLETRNFAAAWVHDDHWAAAEGILKKEKT